MWGPFLGFYLDLSLRELFMLPPLKVHTFKCVSVSTLKAFEDVDLHPPFAEKNIVISS
jgi:hypothetical protein